MAEYYKINGSTGDVIFSGSVSVSVPSASEHGMVIDRAGNVFCIAYGYVVRLNSGSVGYHWSVETGETDWEDNRVYYDQLLIDTQDRLLVLKNWEILHLNKDDGSVIESIGYCYNDGDAWVNREATRTIWPFCGIPHRF